MTRYFCPNGDTDKCPEYKCRTTGVCRQLKRPLQLRCTSCGELPEGCSGHRTSP